MTELQECFAVFDSRYFRFGKKKRQTIIGVEWQNCKGLMGHTVSYRNLSGGPDHVKIFINREYKRARRVWMMTLLHEMVHFKLIGKDKSRTHCGSRMFIKEMKRLASKGAFNGLW